jgi:hypothetical protein
MGSTPVAASPPRWALAYRAKIAKRDVTPQRVAGRAGRFAPSRHRLATPSTRSCSAEGHGVTPTPDE